MGEMTMENGNDVLADVIDRLDAPFGVVMGIMERITNVDDATATVDVRTIDDDIMTITIAVERIDDAELCAYCDERATVVCDVCGASLCNDHARRDGGTYVCRYTYA